DVLLMPPDPEAAVRAVVAAVQKGRISARRIDESVTRVLTAKQTVGLDRSKLVDLEAIADVINSPEAAARAQDIADRAVTEGKNDWGAVPLRRPAEACFGVLSEGRYSNEGQAATQELRQRSAAKIIALDPSLADSELDAAAREASSCEEIGVLAFAS